jgi:hypothetical protein
MPYSTYDRVTNIIFPMPIRTEPNNYFGVGFIARPPINDIPPRRAPDAKKDDVLFLKPPPIQKQFH